MPVSPQRTTDSSRTQRPTARATVTFALGEKWILLRCAGVRLMLGGFRYSRPTWTVTRAQLEQLRRENPDVEFRER